MNKTTKHMKNKEALFEILKDYYLGKISTSDFDRYFDQFMFQLDPDNKDNRISILRDLIGDGLL